MNTSVIINGVKLESWEINLFYKRVVKLYCSFSEQILNNKGYVKTNPSVYNNRENCHSLLAAFDGMIIKSFFPIPTDKYLKSEDPNIVNLIVNDVDLAQEFGEIAKLALSTEYDIPVNNEYNMEKAALDEIYKKVF
jgi:hypothetical protein